MRIEPTQPSKKRIPNNIKKIIAESLTCIKVMNELKQRNPSEIALKVKDLTTISNFFKSKKNPANEFYIKNIKVRGHK